MSADAITDAAGGLCGCFSDPGNCILTMCCYPCMFGKAMEAAGEGCVPCCLLACTPGCAICLVAWQANEKNKAYGGQDQLLPYCLKACCPCTACCQACVVTKGLKELATSQGPRTQTME